MKTKSKIAHNLLMLFFSAVVNSFSIEDNLAQDTTQNKKYEISGYISNSQYAVFDRINNPWYTSQLIYNRLNASAIIISEKLKVNVAMRNRFNWANEIVNSPIFYNAEPSHTGWIDANFDIAKGKSYKINSEFDRFNVTYEYNNIALSAGRQRINWSQTLVWNPNDLFNAYSFFDIDYIERPGSDAIRLQVFPTEVSTAEAAFKIDQNKKITAALLYRFNTYGYDIQCLAGLLEENDFVAGGGWSGSIANRVSFRGEITLIHPKKSLNLSNVTMLSSISFDYTTSSSLSLQGEYFFNQNAPKNLSSDYLITYLSASGNIKNLSPSKHNAVVQLSYPFTPLINGSVAFLYLPSVKGYYMAPSLSYSLAQNLDAHIYWQTFDMKFDNFNPHINLIILRFKLYW
ncbi:MAG: hypothetical protein N2662_07665 [Bacteroidales bacterium]|nr:hypothetical protein [Bacteroidales bacterium]